MTQTSEHLRGFQALVDSQGFAVLATRQQDGHPYASLVAFQASPDLKQIVFCTQRDTRKFANLVFEGRVAMLIDNRSNPQTDLLQAAAATILGTCVEAQGGERAALSQRFLGRHPAMAEFVRSPGCAVMKLNVRAGSLVTRLQNVVELDFEGDA